MLTKEKVTKCYIFPGHALADDIFFTKAHIYFKTGDFETAALYYQKVIEGFGEDLLGDDATFKLAEIYQYKFEDKEKAGLILAQIHDNLTSEYSN